MLFKIQKRKRQEILTQSTDPHRGLTTEEAKLRLAGGWGNRTGKGASLSEGQILLKNCLTFFNLLFVVMAVLLMLAGSKIIKLTFLPVVIVNTVIGCVQEIRAKRAVDKLTLVAARSVPAVRDGKLCRVPSEELVRGDIVEFSAGDQICADGVLREGELQVNEALLTGEADSITKEAGDSLLSGSFVVAGRGRAQLIAVGEDAFAARLAAEARKDPKVGKSEMMRSLDRLIQIVGLGLIPMGLLLFYQQYVVLQLGVRESAEATAAALVGMVPEGLYLLTSIALAVSTLKLTRKRVLVQDMNCIETLARVDVLCVDKTGTITEPAMEVADLLPLNGTPEGRITEIFTALCGSREPENDTAVALHERFSGETSWVCRKSIPFNSEYKWSAGVFEDQGTFLVGAPEQILGSGYAPLGEKLVPLLQKGVRVLLLAGYEGIPEPGQLQEENIRPLALVTLTNRIRPTARETFSYFKKQGVCIKVISGDHPEAVSAVAARAGIENAENRVDVSELTEEELFGAAERCTVFGRVTPEKKRLLIRALKRQGHTVAMTGDGVNDVLAMKEADCGIAMASGAQAAAQVAPMVLLDSDFSALPNIVGEGRRVINNIQRAAALFLVKNIFSLGLSLLTLLTGLPYPLETQHMSIISGLTIGVPGFFLAMEPNYSRVQGRFLSGVLRRALPGGVTNVAVVLAAQGFMTAFSMPQGEISTVCTGILAFVGMLVLLQVCRPFAKFRLLVWCAMAVALVGCFTLLGGIFELHIWSLRVLLILAVLLILTPAVFFTVQRLFDLGDKLQRKLRKN